MTYPNGAIKSVAEFQALFQDSNGVVWEASRKFGTVHRLEVTGNLITITHPDGYKFEGYELGQRGQYNSQLDSHLLPQDYNDWYLFANEADAEAFIQVETKA